MKFLTWLIWLGLIVLMGFLIFLLVKYPLFVGLVLSFIVSVIVLWLLWFVAEDITEKWKGGWWGDD